MSTAAIRDALVALLEAVPEIGRVHAYERFAVAEADFKALYVYQNAIRGWRVSRAASQARTLATGRRLVTETWNIVGLLSLLDAEESEIRAGDLADQIIDAERADPTLGGVLLGRPIAGVSGIQLVAIEPVMFAGALCHRVSLQLQAQVLTGGAAGGLDLVPGAAGGIVAAVAQRIAAFDASAHFSAVEGRIAWDADDIPAALPAALVVPASDRSVPEPETINNRQRVDRTVSVIIVAPAGASSGALAAGGLDILRQTARAALLGWGDGEGGVVDVPLLYAGGAPIDAPLGLVAWRDLYTPSIYLESQP